MRDEKARRLGLPRRKDQSPKRRVGSPKRRAAPPKRRAGWSERMVDSMVGSIERLGR